MKKLFMFLLLNLVTGKNIFASYEEYLKKQNDILKKYFVCTQRVRVKERFLGVDVRSALADCTREYVDAQSQELDD